MKGKTKLYVAYGSNLNTGQMAYRCPWASVYGKGHIDGYELLFRRVATIEKKEGSKVPVGVWRIFPDDEIALDRYEGYPHLYRKEIVTVDMGKEKVDAMVYIMNEDQGRYALPNKSYYGTIMGGYEDIGLDTRYLKTALVRTAEKIEGKK